MAFFKKITKAIGKLGSGILNTAGSLLGLTSESPVQMEAAPEPPPTPEPVVPTPEEVNVDSGQAALERDRRRRGSIAATRSPRPVGTLGGGKSLLG